MSILISGETRMTRDNSQVNGGLKFDNLLEIYNKEAKVEQIPVENFDAEGNIIKASGRGAIFSVDSKWERIEDV
ncbi:MAG TPA: hypothetical protein VFH42_05410, partial [Sporolactobacillaceae bacterium]|nr:hypothetical protein [Sporolactobacillaceae bacterium]